MYVKVPLCDNNFWFTVNLDDKNKFDLIWFDKFEQHKLYHFTIPSPVPIIEGQYCSKEVCE